MPPPHFHSCRISLPPAGSELAAAARKSLFALNLAAFRVIADLTYKHPAPVTKWLNSGLRMKRGNPGSRNRIDTRARLISTEEADSATSELIRSSAR